MGVERQSRNGSEFEQSCPIPKVVSIDARLMVSVDAQVMMSIDAHTTGNKGFNSNVI